MWRAQHLRVAVCCLQGCLAATERRLPSHSTETRAGCLQGYLYPLQCVPVVRRVSRSNRGNLIGTISAQPQLTSSSNACKPWDISVAGFQINSRCSVGEAFPAVARASCCSSAGLFLASSERLDKNNANKKQHIFYASILNIALLS